MPDHNIKLIEKWRTQWSLLQLAVQLDQRWMPSLRRQSEAAVQELFSIVHELNGVKGELAGLGELRQHLLEQIIETGSMLAEGLSVQTTGPVLFGRRRLGAEDILFIARTLDRCVGMRSCELTVNPGAQRALWTCISPTRDRSEPPRRGSELIRHTCSHALSQLEEWLEEERANTERASDARLPYPL